MARVDGCSGAEERQEIFIGSGYDASPYQGATFAGGLASGHDCRLNVGQRPREREHSLAAQLNGDSDAQQPDFTFFGGAVSGFHDGGYRSGFDDAQSVDLSQGGMAVKRAQDIVDLATAASGSATGGIPVGAIVNFVSGLLEGDAPAETAPGAPGGEQVAQAEPSETPAEPAEEGAADEGSFWDGLSLAKVFSLGGDEESDVQQDDAAAIADALPPSADGNLMPASQTAPSGVVTPGALPLPPWLEGAAHEIRTRVLLVGGELVLVPVDEIPSGGTNGDEDTDDDAAGDG